ncbi:conserved phage C-terminal domain-containing protein [Listeria booriae]|uniref:conserved phage C-terminal domain-containing protein n=1 Tax=Listeria booriae TaxID=1552123 RepID=UPI001C8ABB3E|nr:conserved phage C-terminal domain-containing protein [Listeria booriae]
MDQIKNGWVNSFFQVPNAIYDHGDLDVYELAVIQYLFRLSNNKTSFPSFGTIASKVKCSRRKAINVIDSLIFKDYLIKQKRSDKLGNSDSNLYILKQPNIIKEQVPSAPCAPPPVNDVHQPSAHDAPPLVHKVHPINTNIINTNYKDIVGFLNINAEAKFKETSQSTKTLIDARLKEGFTIEDFKTVILNKCRSWKNDPNMAKYLRPSTLFAASKFEGYLNEKPIQRKAGEPDVAQTLSRSGEHDIEIREIDIDDLPF